MLRLTNHKKGVGGTRALAHSISLIKFFSKSQNYQIIECCWKCEHASFGSAPLCACKHSLTSYFLPRSRKNSTVNHRAIASKEMLCLFLLQIQYLSFRHVQTLSRSWHVVLPHHLSRRSKIVAESSRHLRLWLTVPCTKSVNTSRPRMSIPKRCIKVQRN